MSPSLNSTPPSIYTLIIGLALMSANIALSAEFALPARPTIPDNGVSLPENEHLVEGAHGTIDVQMNNSRSDVHTPQMDLWDRIRSGFTMAELDNEEVRRIEDFYASHPKALEYVIERSKRYLFHIVEEVERRGMPAEIALLPIIESAFDPMAYSTRQAAGIWQLIPSTGRTYGLKQNWWYDGRRDIVAATRAALDYLQKLHAMFGEWEPALASYNWGEGAVGRALEKNRNKGLSTDFRNITLPPEMRNYVPKLVAIKNIISNPAAFGIELTSLPNQPYFEQVAAEGHIDVRLAAWLADISVDEFRALNPGHNRPVIHGDALDTLLIPVEKVEIFTENRRNHDQPLVSWQGYKARDGDTAAIISKRYGISLRNLRDVNDMGKHGNVTRGQILLVPRHGNAEGADISIIGNKPPTQTLRGPHFVYLVQVNDTLYEIAKRNGVTVEQIKAWNRYPKHLVPGQKLILKAQTSAGLASTPPNREASQKKRL